MSIASAKPAADQYRIGPSADGIPQDGSWAWVMTLHFGCVMAADVTTGQPQPFGLARRAAGWRVRDKDVMHQVVELIAREQHVADQPARHPGAGQGQPGRWAHAEGAGF